jgi:hypothetical protein
MKTNGLRKNLESGMFFTLAWEGSLEINDITPKSDEHHDSVRLRILLFRQFSLPYRRVRDEIRSSFRRLPL